MFSVRGKVLSIVLIERLKLIVDAKLKNQPHAAERVNHTANKYSPSEQSMSSALLFLISVYFKKHSTLFTGICIGIKYNTQDSLANVTVSVTLSW